MKIPFDKLIAGTIALQETVQYGVQAFPQFFRGSGQQQQQQVENIMGAQSQNYNRLIPVPLRPLKPLGVPPSESGMAKMQTTSSSSTRIESYRADYEDLRAVSAQSPPWKIPNLQLPDLKAMANSVGISLPPTDLNSISNSRLSDPQFMHQMMAYLRMTYEAERLGKDFEFNYDRYRGEQEYPEYEIVHSIRIDRYDVDALVSMALLDDQDSDGQQRVCDVAITIPGTKMKSNINWFTNRNFALTDGSFLFDSPSAEGIAIHAGYAQTMKLLIPEIVIGLKKALDMADQKGYAVRSLTFFGHSSGGVYAEMLSAYVLSHYLTLFYKDSNAFGFTDYLPYNADSKISIPRVKCIKLGSPFTGNAAYANQLQQLSAAHNYDYRIVEFMLNRDIILNSKYVLRQYVQSPSEQIVIESKLDPIKQHMFQTYAQKVPRFLQELSKILQKARVSE
ncbi:hypothetical protein MIR68_010998 [Amoeboaphelidium protococcarum]|nr:hypothetical protein MIR68_010998 [Amoeboaphelidium protococcarum]